MPSRKRRVHELMNPDVLCLKPDTTVREAEQLLARRGVSGAPVVDERGRAVGVVSQSDLVRHQAQRTTAEESGRFYSDVEEYRDIASARVDRSDMPVSEVMTREIYAVSRDTGVAAAASVMRERHVHRLLVTDRGVLVGVVTSMDLLRIVEELG
jgi:CBS domain-containing protein